MSNDVRNFVEVYGGGKLAVEEIEQALYGEAVPADSYYKPRLEKSGRISFWTKYRPAAAELAALAYERNLAVTLEFHSIDNGEVGSMQFFRQRFDVGYEPMLNQDFYRPGGLPRDLAEQRPREEGAKAMKALGVEEAK